MSHEEENDLIITEWALDAYLDLKSKSVFTHQEYRQVLRPDLLLLKNYPNPPKFGLQQFWSPATSPPGSVIPHGYKMKWDSLGSGKVELRLPIGMPPLREPGEVYLCEAYQKENPKQEQRRLARFKVHLQLIHQGHYTERGRL